MKNTITFWECPECKFRVTDLEYDLIKVNPECRCYSKTGIKWSSYRSFSEESVIEDRRI